MRSLAVFRIGLALLILGDLAARLFGDGLRAFHTDAGVLPREVLQSFTWPEWWSLHALSGALWWQIVLFAVATIFALMLLVGYRTRLAVVCSWLLLLSLQARNPLVLHGGDALLRLLLFWAMFLPLDAHFTVRRRSVSKSVRVPLVPSVGLLVQIVAVFLFAFLWKSGPEWRNGTALQYALAIEQMATPLGQWLRDFPALLKVLTYTSFWLELAVAVLLLSPWKAGLLRTVAVFLIFVMQLGFAFSLRVGHFPFVACVAALALLPDWFWQRIPFADTSDHAASLPEHARFARMTNATAAAALLLMLLWNAATLNFIRLPQWALSVARALRLDQQWDMFAPRPLEQDGWYVMIGHAGSQQFDVWRLKTLSKTAWHKPEPREMNAQYPSERWAVFLMDFHKQPQPALANSFSQYLCRRWPHGIYGPEPLNYYHLEHVEIFFNERLEHLNRSPDQPTARKLVHEARCPEASALR